MSAALIFHLGNLDDFPIAMNSEIKLYPVAIEFFMSFTYSSILIRPFIS